MSSHPISIVTCHIHVYSQKFVTFRTFNLLTCTVLYLTLLPSHWCKGGGCVEQCGKGGFRQVYQMKNRNVFINLQFPHFDKLQMRYVYIMCFITSKNWGFMATMGYILTCRRLSNICFLIILIFHLQNCLFPFYNLHGLRPKGHIASGLSIHLSIDLHVSLVCFDMYHFSQIYL